MKSFIKFNLGVMKSPLHVRLWLMLLVAANLAAPLFFFQRSEARVVLAAFAASAALMTVLTARSGFSRLLSAGHIFWIPMIGWLWGRLDQIPADDVFGIWIRVLMMLNSISLVLDTIEVVRYIAGDREEIVEGLPAS